MKTSLVLGASCLISGCSLFTPPMEDPVRQDYAGSFFSNKDANVFSLTPERRTVLVIRKTNTPSGVIVCSEPPSDVAQNIASSFRALAEATAKDTSDKSVGASAELSRSLNTSVISLFYRSQGIQLFRDGLFSICQAYMNGLIKDGQEFWNRYQALLNSSFALIAQEIPSAQTLRNVDLANQMASTKSAVDAAFQAAKEAQASAEKAAEKAAEAVKQIPK